MLYDIGFFIFSIIYLPTLLFKGRLHRDFLERFGRYNEETLRSLRSDKDRIWIQAVSVGEVTLCKALVPLLKKEFPESEIVLSTITKTGNDLAKKIFSKEATIIYFPLDFSFVVKKVVSYIKPKLYIMVETEIWPNLLKELDSRSVPAILVNGRISDRSIGKYRLVKPFMQNTFQRIDKFCMQTRLDLERIIELGAPAGKAIVTGNMKFDVEDLKNTKSPKDIRDSLGLKAEDELFVAASTHKGEEAIVLSAFKELRREFPRLKLLIAPRHLERVPEIEKTIQQYGFDSSKVSHSPNTRILILDTIGQLNDIYSIATIVFIGGSLVKHGGHNPIEPALFERPILFGPHMFNFKTVASLFLSNRAAVQVIGLNDMVSECRFLLKDESERIRLGSVAKELVSKNRGATGRNIDAIKEILK